MKLIFTKPFLLALSLAVSMPAMSVSTVEVDGIKTTGEYTGDDTNTSSGSKSLLWWNNHHSIYTQDEENMNNLDWEITNNSGQFSLNLFFEVPTYARRMIWAAGCDYNGPGTDDDCNVLDNAYLDAYKDGSHHDGVKMDYGTQTGSEYFELNDGSTSLEQIKWQDEDSNGLTDHFTWKTSREYLIDEEICTTILCLEYDRTSSIEMMWTNFGSESIAKEYLDSITDMELHLSDEARGLPPIITIPIPAPTGIALLLLGLTGFTAARKARR